MKRKGYRKLLSVMLACSILVAMPSSEALAADFVVGYENIGTDAAEVPAETEENVMESDIGAEEKEEPETEDMVSEENGGEKEIGETVSENNGSEDAGEGTEGIETDEPWEGAAEPEKETADSADTLPEEKSQGEQAEDVTATAVAEGGETSGSCGANVTWRLVDGVLTISGSGEMEDYQSPHDVKGKSAPWYKYYRNDIKRVVVEEGVTTIGGYAFYVCLHMTSIELPSSITTIGESAFSNCGGLINIELPSGVTSIRESAFYNCWSLTSIELPSGITIIEAGTFEWCQSLTGIELPAGVTTIGKAAFSHCDSLTGIELPAGVTTIGEYAFSSCKKLTSIKLPSGVTIIEKGTFAVCGSLTSIELPSGITSIGANAFYDCDWLTSIALPADVTTIGESAFLSCGRLSGIELPSGVTTIGTKAFGDCIGLTSIELPSGVTTIGKSAFSDCRSLTSIKLPSGITMIEESVFRRCHQLTDIELPSGVTTIGESAFNECSSLTSIGLPSDITTIGNAAFQNCNSLTDVYYGGSESDWRAITIGEYNEPLTSAIIHYNSSGPEEGDEEGNISKYELNFYSRFGVKDNTHISIKTDWGWKLFHTNSSAYNSRLAVAGLLLSAASEHTESGTEAMLKQLGFETVDSRNYSADIHDINYPGVTFAHKKFLSGGKERHIFAIVVRGTTDGEDFLTDYNSVGGGFLLSRENIMTQFDEFVQETCGLEMSSIAGDSSFFVTGHSLGGAVANLIAKKLSDTYGKKDVFSYTYAAPRSISWESEETVGSANNIHNILNKEDGVATVLSAQTKRYGEEIWFHRDNYVPAIYENFKSFTNGGDLKSVMKSWFKIKEKKQHAHSVDVYLSYLLARGDAPNVQVYATVVSVFCPVDIDVYVQDSSLDAPLLVGRVRDNVVDESVTIGTYIYIEGDKKYIYLPFEGDYNIKLTGTDNGTMDYSVKEYCLDSNEVRIEKSYENVTLNDNKRMTSSVSVWDKTDPAISVEDKIDTPQVPLFVLDEDDNIVREVLPDGTGTEIPYTGQSEVLPGDIPADGKIPDGLWIAGVADSYTYTGAAIKPEIRVYDGKKKLQPGKDYTASYKNNTKANDAANPSTAPAVVVKGKGNYAGTEIATFQIMAVALEDSSVTAEDMTVACNKKVQKKVPVVTYNGRKLTKNRDFTVSYPNVEPGAYKEPGTYDILLTAQTGGNFSGKRVVKYIITDNTLLAKVNVKKIPNQTYTGKAIEPELTVTYKNTPLVKGTDYTVSYTDHTEIGTAKAVLTGIGKYAGTKSVSFKITGTSLKGAVLSGIVNQAYHGSYQKQDMTVALHGRILTEGTDYEVDYANNKDVGKASVTIKGKGAYTGTVKKTFRIGEFDIAANRDGRFMAEVKQETVPYAKGGAKPTVVVRFRTGDGRWQTLAEGRDYTLSYRNHTAVNDGSRADRQPTVTVKGKGNFCGTYGAVLSYKIMAQDMGQLTLTAQDKTYQNQENVFATKLTVTDLDGKVLKAGTDYHKTAAYTYAKETAVITVGGGTAVRAAGAAVDKNDIIPAGTVLKVQVQAKEGGNYTGTLEGEYRITQAAISSASVSVPKQVYTGQPITLEKSMLTVKVKGKPLDVSQYEIVPGSYKNNVEKGMASVTIRGVDNYGGTKTVKFTIRAKGFLWWWR